MRALGDSLRAVLCGVDRALWDFAAEYLGYTWNRIPRREYPRFPRGKDKSPIDIRHQVRTERTQGGEKQVGNDGRSETPLTGNSRFKNYLPHFRRFGVLCFALNQPVAERPKLGAKRTPGVFLGYSRTSASYIIGVWKRGKYGLRFDTVESESVKFTDALVRDIQELRPESNSISVSVDRLPELEGETPDTEFEFIENENGEKFTDAHLVTYDLQKEVSVNLLGNELPLQECSADHEVKPESVREASLKFHDPYHCMGAQGSSQSPAYYSGNKCKFPGKRGEFTGNHSGAREQGGAPEMLETKGKPGNALQVKLGYDVDGSDLEIGEEEFVEATVQLSVKKACEGPGAPKWIEAITKERTKLEAARTWRNLTDAEMTKEKKVVPVALILTKKRDGTYKCRAVVLGNLCERSEEIQLYAPVVSMVALRTMLTISSREQNEVRIFDLDNAFLNAHIKGPEVYISLPTAWRSKHESCVKRLLKALYGLPQSPKLWN